MSVEIQRHNSTVLASLEPGDGVEFKRGIHSHWALYIGDSQVIHLTGDGHGVNDHSASERVFSVCGRSFHKANVKQDNFWDVAHRDKAYRDIRENGSFNGGEIVRRAKTLIGPIAYNILWRNCEIFVIYCRFCEWKSEQAEGANEWTFGGIVANMVGTLLGTVLGDSKGKEKSAKE